MMTLCKLRGKILVEQLVDNRGNCRESERILVPKMMAYARLLKSSSPSNAASEMIWDRWHMGGEKSSVIPYLKSDRQIVSANRAARKWIPDSAHYANAQRTVELTKTGEMTTGESSKKGYLFYMPPFICDELEQVLHQSLFAHENAFRIKK